MNWICLPVSSVLAIFATLHCSVHILQFRCLFFHSSTFASCLTIFFFSLLLIYVFWYRKKFNGFVLVVYPAVVCTTNSLSVSKIMHQFIVKWFHGRDGQISCTKTNVNARRWIYICVFFLQIFTLNVTTKPHSV